MPPAVCNVSTIRCGSDAPAQASRRHTRTPRPRRPPRRRSRPSATTRARAAAKKRKKIAPYIGSPTVRSLNPRRRHPRRFIPRKFFVCWWNKRRRPASYVASRSFRQPAQPCPPPPRRRRCANSSPGCDASRSGWRATSTQPTISSSRRRARAVALDEPPRRRVAAQLALHDPVPAVSTASAAKRYAWLSASRRRRRALALRRTRIRGARDARSIRPALRRAAQPAAARRGRGLHLSGSRRPARRADRHRDVAALPRAPGAAPAQRRRAPAPSAIDEEMNTPPNEHDLQAYVDGQLDDDARVPRSSAISRCILNARNR